MVVDTNRPEQVEVPALLTQCERVAVIDHHRVAATFIQNAALNYIEPYASSACELVAEILQELPDVEHILPCEAEALLAGIVLDTKNFTLRTGERTFNAASWLRSEKADTSAVKRLFQSDLAQTVAKYKILQQADIYKGIAVAAPTEPQERVVAAKAADELLNISGVDASIVVAPDGTGGSFASARSIGDINHRGYQCADPDGKARRRRQPQRRGGAVPRHPPRGCDRKGERSDRRLSVLVNLLSKKYNRFWRGFASAKTH